MSLNYKDRDEYTYSIFFYSEPYFILLENQEIVDITIKQEEKQIQKKSTRMYGIKQPKKLLEIVYNDDFFDCNLITSKRDYFSITIQIFNRTGQFLQQIELLGENLKKAKSNEGITITLNYDQVTNNNAWPSLPPQFQEASEVYKREKVSYLRDLQIKKILS